MFFILICTSVPGVGILICLSPCGTVRVLALVSCRSESRTNVLDMLVFPDLLQKPRSKKLALLTPTWWLESKLPQTASLSLPYLVILPAIYLNPCFRSSLCFYSFMLPAMMSSCLPILQFVCLSGSHQWCAASSTIEPPGHPVWIFSIWYLAMADLTHFVTDRQKLLIMSSQNQGLNCILYALSLVL